MKYNYSIRANYVKHNLLFDEFIFKYLNMHAVVNILCIFSLL